MPPRRPPEQEVAAPVRRSHRRPAARTRRPGAAVEAALAAARTPASPPAARRAMPKLPRLSQLPWRSERPEVGDHTRLILRRRNRTMVGTAGTFIIVAILAAVLVLPVRAWFRQRDELADRRRELAAMNQAVADLQAENDRLRTPEGVKDAARQDLGMIEEGEKVIAMLPAPVSEQMPAGWPYSLVGQILATRRATIIVVPTTTAATSPPGTTTPPTAAG